MLKIASSIPSPKAFSFLAMIYAIIIVTSTSLVYKIVKVGPLVITAGALLSPVWYFLSDVIAEVYGYQLSKKLIWAGLVCEGIFVTICATLIHLPSPAYWQHQAAYNQVLGNLPRVYIGSISGTLIAAFVNPFLVAKWKILMRGKYFWIRSIGSSAFSLFLFTTTTNLVDLLGVIPPLDIAKAITLSASIKVMMIPLLVIPASILASFLKRFEGINVYDYNARFNPFSLQNKQSTSVDY